VFRSSIVNSTDSFVVVKLGTEITKLSALRMPRRAIVQGDRPVLMRPISALYQRT
jgi:hypothetical protein